MLPAYFAIPAITGTAPAYAPYSFPDCTSGPLAHTTVCDTSADPITRAEALIAMFTTNDLIRNTDNFSSGVPRLGLPEYDWWSEALVPYVYLLRVASHLAWTAWRCVEPGRNIRGLGRL